MARAGSVRVPGLETAPRRLWGEWFLSAPHYLILPYDYKRTVTRQSP